MACHFAQSEKVTFFNVTLSQAAYVAESSKVLEVRKTTEIEEALSMVALDILSTTGMILPEIAEDNSQAFEDVAMQMFSM